MLKNNTRHAFIAVVATAMVALAGCAGSRTQQSTGEYIDDATITAKVKTALIEDRSVAAIDINVETFKGTVQLSGFADSQAQVDKAVALAREVDGVQSVKNDVRVKPAT